jgi:hypothetical protein
MRHVLGIGFGLLLALLIAGASLVMVAEYGSSRGDTAMSGYVVAVLGVIAILFSMGGIIWMRRFRHDGRDGIAKLILVGILLAEFYIIPAELGWWAQNIKASEQREKVKSLTARANIAQIEKDQSILDQFKTAREPAEIEAAITTELAKSIELAPGYERSLTYLTKDCKDTASRQYSLCKKVLELRGELETAKKVSRAKIEAGTVTTEDMIVKPVNAGAEMAAEITGWTKDWLANVIVVIGLLFMACARLTIMPAVFPERKEAGKGSKAVELAPIGQQVGEIAADVSKQLPAPSSKEAQAETQTPFVSDKAPEAPANVTTNETQPAQTQAVDRRKAKKEARKLGSSPVYPMNNVVKGPFGAGKADALKAAAFALVASLPDDEYEFRDLVKRLDGPNGRFGLIKGEDGPRLRHPQLGTFLKEAFGAAPKRKNGLSVYTKKRGSDEPAVGASAAEASRRHA